MSQYFFFCIKGRVNFMHVILRVCRDKIKIFQRRSGLKAEAQANLQSIYIDPFPFRVYSE
jgi:hypothetical protein